jgi:hypothetical protein
MRAKVSYQAIIKQLGAKTSHHSPFGLAWPTYQLPTNCARQRRGTFPATAMAKATEEGEEREEGVQITAARESLSVHGKIASFFHAHAQKMATSCAAGSVKK